jgi:hypothetical protein
MTINIFLLTFVLLLFNFSIMNFHLIVDLFFFINIFPIPIFPIPIFPIPIPINIPHLFRTTKIPLINPLHRRNKLYHGKTKEHEPILNKYRFQRIRNIRIIYLKLFTYIFVHITPCTPSSTILYLLFYVFCR